MKKHIAHLLVFVLMVTFFPQIVFLQEANAATPPVIQAFAINGGATYTNDENVILTGVITDPDADPIEIRFSNDAINWSTWEPVVFPKSWTLAQPSREGKKPVHMQARDANGLESYIAQRTITLDTTPPVITGVMNGGKYKIDVTPTFTDAAPTTATLNGSPFTSGTTITQDGHYTLTVTDAAGNTTTMQFTIDKTPFAGTVQINQGSGYTNDTNVTLNLTVTDLSGARMAFSNDGVTWSSLEPYSATKQWALTSGEGNKTVHVKFLDDEDNETIETASVVLDQTKPSGTFQINNGAAFTNSRTVELDTIYSDNLSPVEMSISFDNVIWSAWEPAQSKQMVTLSAGDGVKTVYMKLRDLAGNEQAVGNATIHLDTIAPILHLFINNGDAETTSRQVGLSISASDYNIPLEYRLANEDDVWTSWVSFANLPMYWELTAVDGVKTVKLEARDPAGNVAAISKTITLNAEGPIVTGVVDGGIYNSDVVISFNKGTATLNGAPFTNHTTVSREGKHHLVVSDAFGRGAEVHFTLDQTAPSGSFTINGGATTTSSARVNLAVTATDNLSNIEMRIANENGPWSNWQPYTRTVSWMLPNGNGTKKVLLELSDEAGNVTSLAESIQLRVTAPTPTVPVTGISLNEASLTLLPDEGKTLIATISPTNASNKAVLWSSSDPNVAVVNGNGMITAQNPGRAIITATTVDGQKRAFAEVTVKEAVVDIPVTGVELDKHAIKLRVDETKKLRATVQPSDATNKEVVWSSSNPKVATVDEEGEVTAKKPGEAKITVTTMDGKMEDSATITVLGNKDGTLVASDPALWLSLDNAVRINIYLRDDDFLRRITEHPEVSYVSEKGLLTVHEGRIKTGKEEGEDWITVRYQGEELTIPVTISRKLIRSIVVDDGMNAIVEEGEKKQLHLFADLKGGNKVEVTELATWKSSDPDVVKVTADGKIIGGEEGKAVITARYSGREVFVRVLVMAQKEPQKIKVSPSYLNMKRGESNTLTLSIQYEKGYDEIVTDDVKWEIADTNIASVVDGKVEALQKGETTLTVYYGGMETQIDILVR